VGIDFRRGYKDVMRHFGHDIVVTNYHNENVAIECETCNEVLLDFDKDAFVCKECGEVYDDDREQCHICGCEEVERGE
jgi:predicted RNA-binding Zn-ribbon protein involved in translation (DUF1610 family)